MEVKLRADLLARVNKLVKGGRYESVDAFLNSATETLLMAEDRVGMFSTTLSGSIVENKDKEGDKVAKDGGDESDDNVEEGVA